MTKFLRGNREITVALPTVMPPLDDEQLAAAAAMTQDDKLLFSDPGAGKTLTALKAERMLFDANGRRKTLIVCPAIAVYTWLRWIGKMYEDTGHAVVQVIDKGNRAVTPEATHVIVTYGLLSRDSKGELCDRLREWKYDILIADESDNLNGWHSKCTLAVLGLPGDKARPGLFYNATFCWMLTGTPIPRYNDGLYPVLRALFPNRLDKYHVREASNFLDTFTIRERVRYGKMKFAKEQVSGSRNNKLLRELLFDGDTPICIRIKLKLRDEPIIRFKSLDFKLSKELEALENDLGSGDTVEGDRFIDPRLAVALNKLGNEMVPHIVKDLQEVVRAKRKAKDHTGILVLYWHRTVGDKIAAWLEGAGYKVGMINGRTNAIADAETERAFNAGELDFVVGQVKAMGVAINLQENCDTVFFAEDSFSDAANLQAYQRVWRRGQERQVNVTFYRALQSSLADMRPRTAAKKRIGARAVLDGGN